MHRVNGLAGAARGPAGYRPQTARSLHSPEGRWRYGAEAMCSYDRESEMAGDQATDDRPAPQPSDVRFRELLLDLCWQSADDPTFDVTKLTLLLFFVDFQAYRDLGHPVTGDQYVRMDTGPAPRTMPQLWERLVQEGAVVVRAHPVDGLPQERMVAIRSPDLSVFTPHELGVIDAVLQQWWRYTAREISTQADRFRGWQLAELGETLPYPVALYELHTPTIRDAVEAASLAASAHAALIQARGSGVRVVVQPCAHGELIRLCPCEHDANAVLSGARWMLGRNCEAGAFIGDVVWGCGSVVPGDPLQRLVIYYSFDEETVVLLHAASVPA